MQFFFIFFLFLLFDLYQLRDLNGKQRILKSIIVITLNKNKICH
jgi:hypothetical protein